MGTISSGTGEEVSPQSTKQGSEGQNAGINLDGSISKANKAASDFIQEVKGVETELEAQIAGYELAMGVLRNQIKSLQEELKNQPDCEEKGGMEFRTDAQLAGEEDY